MTVLIFLIILIRYSHTVHSDPVNNAIRNYENQLSVKKIRETITSTFHFYGVDIAEVENSICTLNSSKVGIFKNILSKCLKVTSDICSPFLETIWNQELVLNKKLNYPCRCLRYLLKPLLFYQLVLRDINLLRHMRLALHLDIFSMF